MEHSSVVPVGGDALYRLCKAAGKCESVTICMRNFDCEFVRRRMQASACCHRHSVIHIMDAGMMICVAITHGAIESDLLAAYIPRAAPPVSEGDVLCRGEGGRERHDALGAGGLACKP